MSIIQVECLAAGALQLLLRLKRHLKIVYDLNDARCQVYSPNESLNPGEGLSRQSLPFNVNEINIEHPKNYEDFFRRYQDFKNALKEDAVDYAIYTANIKRKRPPPRRSRKSGRMMGGDDEDDEDDEDWGSGMRTSNSARRSSSSFLGTCELQVKFRFIDVKEQTSCNTALEDTVYSEVDEKQDDIFDAI
ncbi:hypothetical protein CQW23_09941 [Capsicum baccatum]|uniref:Uncharacterized protein n=1 Tax=Capsicum baccatum TaxID=33114 RepID=A0A2G2WY71_CAPBA|nr:hypothetical protein CQW23_09941 [Capsicum baccatum]